MATLFESDAPRPLADLLRPQCIDDVVGQESVLGANGLIHRMLSSGRLSSIVLWGPPGTGKTTIARLLANETDLAFTPLSAVFSGVADVRKAIDEARRRRDIGQGTLLFVDEIHRFNRAQQDGFLPFVEDGTVVLVGATTENPSFELNAALLSRAQVVVLERLDDAALETLIVRAEAKRARSLPLEVTAREALRRMADGDGRYLLNMVDVLMQMPLDSDDLSVDGLTSILQQRAPVYDKSQDGHYNLISALHKALRGSDVDASLYWFARILAGGEQPGYVARRLVRFASEDVGMADPNALVQAISAWDAFDRLGSPEGELALVQCVTYLATAPKSNALYRAEKAAKKLAKETGSLMPPKHILNAPTKMMKDMGYGAGYEYDHNSADGFSGQDYFPAEITRTELYSPVDRGFEREIAKRLSFWSAARTKKSQESD